MQTHKLNIKAIICHYSTPNHYTPAFNTMYSIHFRKMQEGDAGASNSDMQTDKGDDDVTHMPERCVQKIMARCFQHETS